jgi:LPS-assembly protein
MFRIGLLLKYVGVFLLGVSISINSLFAIADEGKIELKAKHIETQGDIVTATKSVVVTYDNMVIRANTAKFNKKTKMLALDGDIETIGYDGTKEHSNHLDINTKTKEMTFQELFLVSENDVWIMSDKVKKKENKYNLGTSLLSSCDISDPLWTMRFSDSTYSPEENLVQLYNAKLYMLDVPIFYTPYLSYTTNKERKSGLLFPLFGYTEDEGYFYEQPVFWAISESMDLEVNPQIRTDRSLGLYSTLRFVDSNHSQGVLRAGYFKDQSSFTNEFNLPNDSHYGIEFNYSSTSVFQDYLPEGFKDGVYINTTYLNDIEYITLQKNQLTHFGYSPLQQSRLNYFAQNNDYYVGLNAKYFIDTREGVNDDETIQVLPSIQLHKYLEHFISENFTYSADFKVNNFDRKEGATMQQAELRIPLEYTTSFFDDFVSLSLGEELYYSKFFFGNGDFVYDDFQYYSNVHKAKLFTDLTKNFDGFIHVLQPSISYLKPGNQNQSPVEASLLNDEQKELFTVGLPEEEYAFALSQYFYDENMQLKFYQRLTQKYYVDREYKLADLNNEMQYNWDKISLYNILTYAHEFDKIRISSSSFSLRGDDYSMSLGHSYRKGLADQPAATDINDVYFNFAYRYNQKISFNGALTYDVEDTSSRQWRFGGKYYKDCWSFDASIRQDIRPSSAGAIVQNTYFVQLNFTPFGSIGTNTLNQLQQ